MFYLSEAPSPPMTPYFPPLHTGDVGILYTIYLFTQGKKEGESLTIEKGRWVTVHKAGSKIPT
jgi:hypothetical protein